MEVSCAFLLTHFPAPSLNNTFSSLNKVKAEQGVRGLYRGVGTNVFGNAASWGMYFWL